MAWSNVVLALDLTYTAFLVPIIVGFQVSDVGWGYGAPSPLPMFTPPSPYGPRTWPPAPGRFLFPIQHVYNHSDCAFCAESVAE